MRETSDSPPERKSLPIFFIFPTSRYLSHTNRVPSLSNLSTFLSNRTTSLTYCTTHYLDIYSLPSQFCQHHPLLPNFQPRSQRPSPWNMKDQLRILVVLLLLIVTIKTWFILPNFFSKKRHCSVCGGRSACRTHCGGETVIYILLQSHFHKSSTTRKSFGRFLHKTFLTNCTFETCR